MFGGKAKPANLPTPRLCLAWRSAAEQHASIQSLEQWVEDQAQAAIDWYERKKGRKATASWLIRYLAVGLTSLAGLYPIAVSLGMLGAPGAGDGSGAVKDTGLVVSLFVGLAASLIGIDRFGGFSTGWIRYVRSATVIKKSQADFQLDFELLRSKLSDPPTQAQVEQMILRAKEFLSSVQLEVMQETQQWATEFESNLSQLEKDVKTKWAEKEAETQKRMEAAMPGSLIVTVANADALDAPGFKVVVKGPEGLVADETVEGERAWTCARIAPGKYTVRVTGAMGGVPASDAKIVEVAPNSSNEAVLTVRKAMPAKP